MFFALKGNYDSVFKNEFEIFWLLNTLLFHFFILVWIRPDIYSHSIIIFKTQFSKLNLPQLVYMETSGYMGSPYLTN